MAESQGKDCFVARSEDRPDERSSNARGMFVLVFPLGYIILQYLLGILGMAISMYGRSQDDPLLIYSGHMLLSIAGVMTQPTLWLVKLMYNDAESLAIILSWINALIIAYIIYFVRKRYLQYMR